MEREQLAGILRGDGEVVRLCREALLRDAAFQVWHDGDAALTPAVASIYSRRAKLIRKRGQTSLGVDDRPANGYYFQLFITPALDRVIACLAVGSVPHGNTPH
ncbi:hypothetical protein I6A84_43410 [Frankia sp. CNm7]|uniref:Uncharacterized protein n=2 Tax=Frankia nepalensis TaxID=1836974 RepID=A0A937USR9_9ACTN|nr:hypothetical protein [Frankia nepalensis]MBL7524713.1 hypothetical protein [Frankia nepalensis]MBL7632398.1 hypothetical protein [Frankia nepalensis]